MRICVVGLGTVGRWLVGALHSHAAALRRRGIQVDIVGVANRRDGLIYRDDGLDPAVIDRLDKSGQPISAYPGVASWATADEGLRHIDIDVLVETSASPPTDGEPGLTHMREVLKSGGNVVTSNKWPVALAGVELVELARGRGVAFRAESTVMSGTPVLGPLMTGLAGTTPTSIRGVLNATSNAVLTMMRDGRSYDEALAAAQHEGLAEPDPAADVDGHDAVAKVMILSALLAGRQLRRSDVGRRGISAMTEAELQAASDPGQQIRELSNLEFGAASEGGEVRASVEPTVLATNDPLSRIEGTTNAIVCTADPLGEIQISGPGAGPHIAGYGCFIDLLALSRP